MKNSVLLGATAAALVVTAACNRSEDKAESASNVTSETVAQGSAGGPGGAGAAGQPLDAQAAFRARHEGFERMAKSFKALNKELKGDSPDVETVRGAAGVLAQTAPQIASWFPAGSGQDANSRSHAKDAIWTDNADFQRRAQSFVQTSAAFRQTAQGGDVAAMQAALPQLGNGCKECHDRYRQEER
jgi:cytochrome c556